MTETDLTSAADAEMRANLHRPVIVQMKLPTVMGIVGLVQLASRHPGISPAIRQGAKEWVESIRIYCLNEGWPASAALIDAGWLPPLEIEEKSQ